MAIDGNGYFILNDGGTIVYSRAGAFEFDAEGNLVNTSGLRVMGYLRKGVPMEPGPSIRYR